MFDHRFAEQAASQHAADLRAAAERRRRARPARAVVRLRGRWSLTAPDHRPVVLTPQLRDC